MLTSLLLAMLLAAQPTPESSAYTLATCDDPSAREAMLAAGPDGFPIFRAVKDASRANDARMTRLLDRLTERARLTPDQRAGVAISMVEDTRFKAAFRQGATLLEKVMTTIMTMTGKDARADCRAVIAMSGDLPAIEANAQQQWDAIRRVLEDEAKRRGVSLAD